MTSLRKATVCGTLVDIFLGIHFLLPIVINHRVGIVDPILYLSLAFGVRRAEILVQILHTQPTMIMKHVATAHEAARSTHASFSLTCSLLHEMVSSVNLSSWFYDPVFSPIL